MGSALAYGLAATLWTGVLVVLVLAAGCALTEVLVRVQDHLERRREVDRPW